MSFEVRRVYVEKRQGFDAEALKLKADFTENLQLNNLKNVRVLNRYNVSNLNDDDFQKAVKTVFSESNQDCVYEEIDFGENVVAVEA